MYIKGDKRESITPMQFYVDKDIYIKESDKVLAVNTRVQVVSTEALQGEMRVSYRITYKVIYMADGACRVAEESSDHTAQIKSQSVTPKSYVDACASVISCEHVGESNVKIRTMLEIKGYAITSVGFDTADIPDGAFARYEQITVQTITPVNCAETVAEGTQNVKENIGEILTVDTDICVESVSIATDMCEISGVCHSYITYVSDGNPASMTVSYPFMSEAPAPGIKDGDNVRICAYAKSSGTTVTETDGGAEVAVESIICVKGTFSSRSNVDVPVDVYAKARDLKPLTSTAVLESSVCTGDATDRFSAGFTPEDGKGCAKVLCVCAPWIGAASVTASDGLAVEGIVCAEVVYLDLDDDVKRMLAEIPYRVVVDGDFACSGNLEADVTVTDIGAKVRRANEIEAFGAVCVKIYGTEESETIYLAEIKDIGETIPNDSVISLYIVGKGESLYDVAKALRSDEEELLAMNPEVELPLQEGDKILLYRI